MARDANNAMALVMEMMWDGRGRRDDRRRERQSWGQVELRVAEDGSVVRPDAVGAELGEAEQLTAAQRSGCNVRALQRGRRQRFWHRV